MGKPKKDKDDLFEGVSQEFSKNFRHVMTIVEKITKAAVTHTALGSKSQNEKGSVVNALAMGLGAATGALAITAQIVTKKDEKFASQDQFLFTAILCALCYSPSSEQPKDDEGFAAFEYGVATLADAMDMFERATGRKPDDLLLEPMVAAARKAQAEGDVALKSFLESRATKPPAV